jgi:[histone H3]-lysine36 N-trimethyltransferase
LAMKAPEEFTPPEPRTKFISRDPPRPESYRRKRRIVQQTQSHDHDSHFSNRFVPPSPGELEREMYARQEKERLERFHHQSVRDIIASAAEAAAAKEAAAIVEAKAKADAAVEKAARKKDKDKLKKKSLTSEEHEANKEKRLLKLIGAVVVKSMSKYSKSFDHDTFKKHAKEV